MTDPQLGEPSTRRYCHDLAVALRVREVPGRRIGAVLAEVRAHLAESGEDPVRAFGTPTDYAASLTTDVGIRPVHQRVSTRLRLAAWCLGGIWLVTGAAVLITGGPYPLGPWPLLATVVAVTGAPRVLRLLGSASRAVRGLAAAMVGAVPAVFASVAVRYEDVGAVPVSPWVPTALGALLLAADRLGGRTAPDPVIDPLDDADTVQARLHRATVVANVVEWSPWLLTAVVVAVVVLSSGTGG